MGTSLNAKGMAAKIAKFGATLPASVAVGLVAAGKTIEVSVSAASGKYARSPLTRTRSMVRRGENPNVLVRMVDRKAHLLDHDTKPHGRTKGSPGKPGDRNPRTEGKLMWEKGVAAGTPAAVAAVDRAIGDGMLKAFGL